MDGGGLLPVVEEFGGFVDEVAIGAVGDGGEFVHSRAPRLFEAGCAVMLGRTSHEDGMDDLFEVAASNGRIAIPLLNHFPLLGNADAGANGFGRLG